MSLSVSYKNQNCFPRFLFVPGGRRREWFKLTDTCFWSPALAESVPCVNHLPNLFMTFSMLQPSPFPEALLSWDRCVLSRLYWWSEKGGQGKDYITPTKIHSNWTPDFFVLGRLCFTHKWVLSLPTFLLRSSGFVLPSNSLYFSSYPLTFLPQFPNPCSSLIQGV